MRVAVVAEASGPVPEWVTVDKTDEREERVELDRVAEVVFEPKAKALRLAAIATSSAVLVVVDDTVSSVELDVMPDSAVTEDETGCEVVPKIRRADPDVAADAESLELKSLLMLFSLPEVVVVADAMLGNNLRIYFA